MQLVKRLSVERRAKTAEVKKTMHHEAEAKLEAMRDAFSRALPLPGPGKAGKKGRRNKKKK